MHQVWSEMTLHWRLLRWAELSQGNHSHLKDLLMGTAGDQHSKSVSGFFQTEVKKNNNQCVGRFGDVEDLAYCCITVSALLKVS